MAINDTRNGELLTIQQLPPHPSSLHLAPRIDIGTWSDAVLVVVDLVHSRRTRKGAEGPFRPAFT